jgi:hypothetical protein
MINLYRTVLLQGFETTMRADRIGIEIAFGKIVAGLYRSKLFPETGKTLVG